MFSKAFVSQNCVVLWLNKFHCWVRRFIKCVVLHWRSISGKIFCFECFLFFVVLECASKTLVLSCSYFFIFFLNSSSSFTSRNSFSRGGAHSTGSCGMRRLFSSTLTSSGLSKKTNDSLSALRSLNLIWFFSKSLSSLPHPS